MEEHARSVEVTADDAVDSERRAALGRMGKLALAPAVVTLLTVDAGAAWAGSRPVNGRPKRKKARKSKSRRRH
jgi:hypothetical protein